MKKALIFFMLAFAAVVIADQYDKWLEEVKPLITEQEKADFKRLKTDAEKEQFTKDFWAKRDPNKETPENEYKDNYDQNIHKVDEAIKSQKKKGHETDMGQALLLLGPPSEQKSDDNEENPSRTWIYRSLPAEVASGEIQLLFEPDQVSGGWKFADKKKAGDLLEKARENVILRAQASGHAQEVPQEKIPSPPVVVEGSGASAVTTPALKTALDATAAGTAPTDIQFHALADSFSSSTGETFATFAVTAPADAATGKVGVRIMDASGAVVKEAEYAMAAPGEAAGYFQSSLPVGPGDYTAAIAVANGDKAGGEKHTLKVPDATKFSLSSIILSKKFNQLTEAKPEKEPYTFGKIKVDPNVNRTFAKADELIIVYEAYGFQKDATGNPALEATISFQKDKDRPKTTAPTPPNGLVTGNKITVPTSFPLSGFPAGNYKMTLTLKDKTSGESVTGETTFTVE